MIRNRILAIARWDPLRVQHGSHFNIFGFLCRNHAENASQDEVMQIDETYSFECRPAHNR
jgi:hypothetical protein